MRAAAFATSVLCMIACSTNVTTTSSSSSGGDPPSQPPPTNTSRPVDPVAPSEDWPSDTSCTGEPGELYELKVKRLFQQDEFPLCAFKGRVLLMFNGASYCGYTYQYGPLQKLYAKYKSQGLSVLGFPSNSFNQEGDTAAEISEACLSQYEVKFPVFAIGSVKGADIQPVFAWLTSQPGATGEIPWNFEKFLVSREGRVVKRFAYTIDPDPAKDPQIEEAIQAELAK